MADSAFWRELAAQFLELPDMRADGYYNVGSDTPWNWQLAEGASDFARRAFETLATRGASEVANAGDHDLFIIWLEALRNDGLSFRFHGQGYEPQDDGTKKCVVMTGAIEHVCQASATYCKKLEGLAVQAEFREKQRDNPKNWSPFHQEYEAFRSIKAVISEPAERISEEWVRNTIARISGIMPEDVTRKQIAFEVAGLLSSTNRHIELIPSAPQGSPPAPETKPEVQTDTAQPSESRVDPKTLRASYLANFPDEKIKIRDLCWAVRQHRREWTRWLAQELKDGSTPDLAFRRILTSGKRPREFDKTPRPKGWE